MIKIVKLEINQSEEWDRIVKGFKNYDVYYLNGYVKGFEVHGDGTPVLIYMQDANFKAINVVMKREISSEDLGDSNCELFDFATPYGYGGMLVEGDLSAKHMGAYRDYCKSIGIVSEFVRFNPMTKNHEACRKLYDVQMLGNTIAIDLIDKEYIWDNFSSKNRNVIRKAIKEGVTIKHTKEPWIIETFMEIYNSTMDRDEATAYYYFKREYYDTIVNDLNNNFEFFYAEKDEEIIAVSIILFANDRMHYHLSASKREFQKFAPTNLLLYEVSKYGIDNGYKSFHLGGGVGSNEDGLYKFKKSFNKNEDREYYIGKLIIDEDKYRKLVNDKIGTIINENYFPKYRG